MPQCAGTVEYDKCTFYCVLEEDHAGPCLSEYVDLDFLLEMKATLRDLEDTVSQLTDDLHKRCECAMENEAWTNVCKYHAEMIENLFREQDTANRYKKALEISVNFHPSLVESKAIRSLIDEGGDDETKGSSC